MLSRDEKKELILSRERTFAAQLGQVVLSKPKVHAWMIFIPFLFVFFIQDLMKYKKGRKEFSENYLLSHVRALQEAENALVEERKPDTDSIARQSELKGKARQKYAAILAILAEHYIGLLEAEGEGFPSLVKAAYGDNYTNYLLFLNQLAQAEKSLNEALLPRLSKTREGVHSVIEKMEDGSNRLRRAEAEKIFGEKTATPG